MGFVIRILDFFWVLPKINEFGLYRDGIILWPNFGNDVRNICVGPIWVIIWEIFLMAQFG